MGYEQLGYKQKEDYRSALSAWLQTHDHNCALTLAFNDGALSVDFIKDRAKELLNRLDRKMLGKRYLKQPDKRIQGIFFIEKIGSNAHLQASLKINTKNFEGEFRRLLTTVLIKTEWSKLCQKGSVDVQMIRENERWQGYVTKEYQRHDFAEHFFFAEEFFGNTGDG